MRRCAGASRESRMRTALSVSTTKLNQSERSASGSDGDHCGEEVASRHKCSFYVCLIACTRQGSNLQPLIRSHFVPLQNGPVFAAL
jgi:hypothetical protein